jgi:pimeloyl-ACP methyl ester carboxylesterase
MAGQPIQWLLLLTAVAVLATACATTVRLEIPSDSDASAVDGGGTNDPGPDNGAASVSSEDGVQIAGRFTWTDDACDFAEPGGVNTTCGWLEVPERWDDPNDATTIRLHVGIFSSGPSDAAPVVYLEGGPGGDALANIDSGFDVLFGGLVTNHEIVVLGQRGTGSAEPTLSCPNVREIELELLDETLGAADELDSLTPAYVACAEDLRARGVDTVGYNSVQNAHDVEALRLALEHDQWNVLGISYGTRLAQTLMRLHPAGVRASILDSVLAYEREPTFDIPTVAKRAFETLFAECAASNVCATTHPDLENRFFALVDELDASPLMFPVADLFSGDQYPAAVNGDGLMNAFFSGLYSKSSVSALPELVAQLEVGETSGIETLLSQEVTGAPFFAEGMYWAVECHEEVPFLATDGSSEARTGDPRYDRMQPPSTALFVGAVCGALDAGTADPVEDQLLVSDIPTLLLAGIFDPITPPADTESLLAGLENGQYVEFPHTGHGAMADPCGHTIALDFLADPTAGVDTDCLAAVEEPLWDPDIFADISFDEFNYDAGFYSGSGVAPVGWESDNEGTFSLSDNALHVSVLLQQAVPGEVAALLLSNVADFLSVEPVTLDPVDAGGRPWQHFEAAIPGNILDFFVAEGDGETLFVLMQHAPTDRDRALEVLTQPLLDAMAS